MGQPKKFRVTTQMVEEKMAEVGPGRVDVSDGHTQHLATWSRAPLANLATTASFVFPILTSL